MADRYDRPAQWITVGSGVAGPMMLVTSGQRIDRAVTGVTYEVRWGMNGTANSGYAPEGYPPFAAGAQSLTVPVPGNGPGGTIAVPVSSTGPLVGGAPAGTFMVGGSSDGVYYTDLGVTVSSLFGVSASGTRLINVSGALPPWLQLTYNNTASSGVFDVSFSTRTN